MLAVKCLVTLASLLGAVETSRQPDVIIYGRYLRNQVLPCRFHTGFDLVVIWSKEAEVHSYYLGQDQLAHQTPEFNGRTSLFHDQLTRGNASLLLKKVQVSDRGRYKCTTRNWNERKESFVYLEVDAPVTKVSIVQDLDWYICRSEGIYPKPQVTWSRNTKADTRIEQTEHQLYNIWSSVRVDDRGEYSCDVLNLRSSRRATVRTTSMLHFAATTVMLHCPVLKSSLKSVTWRFYDKMMAQGEGEFIITEKWRDHVRDLSMSGTLTLQNLSPDLSGLYTCEVTNQEETRVKIINLTIPGAMLNAILWLFIICVLLLVTLLSILIHTFGGRFRSCSKPASPESSRVNSENTTHALARPIPETYELQPLQASEDPLQTRVVKGVNI